MAHSVQPLHEMASSTSSAELLGRIAELVGGPIGLLSHDLNTIADADPDRPLEIDGDPLERLLDHDHQGHDHRGDDVRALVDGMFPIAFVRGGRDHDPAISALIGQLLSHHLPVFDYLDHLRRRKAMSAAAQLQWDQLPSRSRRIGRYAIGAALEPAYEVAGDLFDFAASVEGDVVLYALDAMGHGVEATLSASLALAAIRASRRNGAPLREQVDAAHESLAAQYDGARFVTLVAVRLADDGVEVVNAGHEPIRRGDRDGLSSLEIAPYPPLGVEGPRRHESTMLPPLERDEALVLLSDGASGARDTHGDPLGAQRVNELLAELWSSHPLLMAHRLAKAVIGHSGGTLDDDLTSVVVTCG